MTFFVRGIMGDVKLNPTIKLWGGLLLFVSFVLGGLTYQIMVGQRALAECQERGGVWIGSTPAGLGRLARIGLYQGKCEFSSTPTSTD